MKRYIEECIKSAIFPLVASQQDQFQEIKLLLGQLLVQQAKSYKAYDNISDSEFKVFSQFGDDGIIQYLIRTINIQEYSFIEFGVQNYIESNTRFLLINNNWRGLVADGNSSYINSIKRDSIYWRYDITAVCAFLDRDNINQLFIDNGFCGEIGILSIDIDGNDYWVWEAINSVNPAIVIIEYNSVFGSRQAITMPYDPRFLREKAHFSHLYWGCSLQGLCLLAERKGYSFVGSNSNGNNSYFVRNDLLGPFKKLTAQDGYVESKFRESRDESGRLSYASGNARLSLIEDMPVYDLEANRLVTIRELTGGKQEL